MSDYNQLKNAAILNPTTNTDLGSDTNRFSNVYMTGSIVMNNGVTVTSTNVITPKISSVEYPNTATATDTAGGETITINGSGFASGVVTYVAGAIIGVTNFVSSTQLTFSAPAKAIGSYTLVVVNSDGGTASYIPGLTYSSLPVWSTAAGSLGSSSVNSAISSVNLSASENAQSITYAVTTGSLPTGLTLSSGGTLTGTPTGSTATYNFTVTATDPQGQKATRNFSYTISPPMLAGTGGTITTSGNYKFHTFTTSGTFTISVSPAASSIQYLIVAGGASGGTGSVSGPFAGGGGGAGGYLTGTMSNPSVQSYTITVGAGGTSVSGDRLDGNKGANSSAFGSTVLGGGAGTGPYSNPPPAIANGGSGGGGATYNNGGTGTAGQGNNGGRAGGAEGGGGGGGAGAAGGAGNDSGNAGTGGVGGVGSTWLDGNTYAGGGGGSAAGSFTGALGGAGGAGGGGAGGRFFNIGGAYLGVNGTPNTGGGGGGGGRTSDGSAAGTSGGSGVVIIRYQYQ